MDEVPYKTCSCESQPRFANLPIEGDAPRPSCPTVLLVLAGRMVWFASKVVVVLSFILGFANQCQAF